MVQKILGKSDTSKETKGEKEETRVAGCGGRRLHAKV